MRWRCLESPCLGPLGGQAVFGPVASRSAQRSAPCKADEHWNSSGWEGKTRRCVFLILADWL